jgi:nucleoside-diphosphate-sugar epimerase
MDVSKLRSLGWSARTPLEAGLRESYRWYAQNIAVKTGTRT